MKLSHFPVVVLLFIGASQSSGQTTNRPAPPAAASEELQRAVASAPWPALSELAAPPDTDDEWRQHILEIDELFSAGSESWLAKTGVDVQQDRIAGVVVHRLTPKTVRSENQHRLFVFVHGGSYIYGSGAAGLLESVLIAERLGIPVLSIDYRMPPDHPFPAAIDDVLAVYDSLRAARPPGSMIIGGSSAGAGLTLAVMQSARDNGSDLPGAIYAGTPWSDLTSTGDTMITNRNFDRVLRPFLRALTASGQLYARGQDMTNPLISPVYGDFDGFPPTILISGTRDLLLSDVVRTHRKLRQAGVNADLHIYEGMSHAGYMVSPETPESADAYRELGKFIDEHLESGQ